VETPAMSSESSGIRTFCRICEPACGLLATGNGAELRLLPDKTHPVHQGFACSKGLHFVSVHRDPDRVNHPLRRRGRRSDPGATFERVSWDSALDDIGERLRRIRAQYGPDGIGGYFGNPGAFNSKTFLSMSGLVEKLGSQRAFSAATQDTANKFAASEAMFGAPNLQPIPDLEHTHYFLCLGGNPKVSHMTLISAPEPMKLIRGITARGGKVLYVNPRNIESAGKDTGETLLVAPDTDLYFLASLIHEVHELGGINWDVLARHVTRVDPLLAFVARYPATRTAAVTGIDAGTVRAIAQDLIAAPSACTYMSTGVNMGRQGTLAYWLLQMLSLVTGNFGRRGGNIYSPGFCPTAGAGAGRRKDPYFDTPFGRIRRVSGVLPGNLLPDFIEAGEPPLRALIVVAGNPLLSIAGESRLRAAFDKLELLISIDLYRNATGELADYVLPAADWLEREDINLTGLGFQVKPYVQYTPAVVEPVGERREDWWIIAKLEQALGVPSLLDAAVPNPFAGVDKLLRHSGLSIAELKCRPDGLALLPPPDPEAIFTLGIHTPDKRIDACPQSFDEALARAERLFEERAAAAPDQLHLITRRNAHMHNSWYHNLPQYKGEKFLHNPLWMHPEDARQRGLAEGDRVAVRSAHGRIEGRLGLDATLRSRVVAMTHGWGHRQAAGLTLAQRHPGVNVNELAPSGPGSFEPLSNQSFLSGIPVSVERIG